ncbi:MAG: hypothetical protein H5U11_17055 [Rhizobium sp.]|nr:hypothetical protein [Rhizobium sp.]
MTERKQKLDAQLCKHSYDEATERVSRLASYATSRSLKKIGFGDYYSLAEELCKKDIIVLSISIRRLAEMTKSAAHLKELKVRSFNTDNEKTIQRHKKDAGTLLETSYTASKLTP